SRICQALMVMSPLASARPKMLSCIMAPTASGKRVKMSMRIGFHPLNEMYPHEARLGVELLHKFLHGGNEIFPLALDHVDVVAGGREHLGDLADFHAVGQNG